MLFLRGAALWRSGYPAGLHGGFAMFGPLPALHKVTLVLAALIVCTGLGFWLGAMPEVPINLRAGVLAGTVAGAVAAFVLVHDFRQRHPRPARARRQVR